MKPSWTSNAPDGDLNGPSVLAVGLTDRSSSAEERRDNFNPIGSGICVSRHVVVTCYHVIKGAHDRNTGTVDEERVGVLTENGQIISPVKVWIGQKLDIAILAFKEQITSCSSLIAIGSDGAEDHLRQRKFCAVGCPGLRGGRAVESSRFQTTPLIYSASRIQISGGLVPGNSGGALVLDDHELQPVIGMPQLGGKEAAATSLLTSEVIVEFMAVHGLIPERLAHLSDLLELPRTADTLHGRRATIARYLGMQTILDFDDLQPGGLDLQFSLLPPAVFPGPDGRLTAIERPAAIMIKPASLALLKWARDEQPNPGDAHLMATEVTVREIEKVADRVGNRVKGRMRLATSTEWWLGVTAGSGKRSSAPYVMDDDAAREGTSLRQLKSNDWHVQRTPLDRREWAMEETGGRAIYVAIAPDGFCRPRSPKIAHPALGFRLVCDDWPQPRRHD